MNIERRCGSYNARRCGKPWIAHVTFATSNQGEFRWGEYVGDDGGGLLILPDVAPGDIIAEGQKDFRKPRNSAPTYYQLSTDGKLIQLQGKADALIAWRRANAERSNPQRAPTSTTA